MDNVPRYFWNVNLTTHAVCYCTLTKTSNRGYWTISNTKALLSIWNENAISPHCTQFFQQFFLHNRSPYNKTSNNKTFKIDVYTERLLIRSQHAIHKTGIAKNSAFKMHFCKRLFINNYYFCSTVWPFSTQTAINVQGCLTKKFYYICN